MKRMNRLSSWVIGHPKTILILIAIITAAAISQFPKLRAETNLEAMFPDNHPTIKFNDQVEEWFQIKDSVVKSKFGIKPQSVFFTQFIF